MKETSTRQGGKGTPLPEASNSATSITNFEDRAFIDFNEDTSQTVDVRSQKSLFGRVDEFNNAIYPNIDKVSFDPELRVFGFDFALTLMRQLATEWSAVNNQVSQFSAYKNAAFTNKDFRSIDEAFQNHYTKIFEDFRRELFDTGEEVNVVDFDSYVVKFMHFLKRNKLAFTREALIKSDSYHPHNSLLMYSLQNVDHGDDEKTVVDYYRDPSFEVFGDFMLHHGLVLDRHSPWRFVVNVKSPQVQNPNDDREMPWKEIGLTKLLSTYFKPAFETEAEITRNLLVENYNSFVPLARKKAISQCASTLKPLQLDINRSLVEGSEAVNLSVINFLIGIREAETEKMLSKAMKNKILNKLQLNIEDVNLAYEQLHTFLKQKQMFTPPAVLDRIDALAVANYLRCEGAHRSAATGTWIPCKSSSTFFSRVKSRKGANEVLSTLLANINKEQIEEYQEQILDSLDPF